MKKINGFTLIELIAIISILGILALIAVPTVNNIVKNSKIEANQRSSENYMKALNNAVILSQTEKGIVLKDGMYTLAELREKGIVVDNSTTYDGSVVIKHSTVVSYIIRIDDYIYDSETNHELLKVYHEEGETHFGIVYMDPTDITKICTEEDALNNKVSNKYTGIKTGCMKWYILGETDYTYNLLLDHHTTAHVAWNIDGGTTPKTVTEQLEIDTKDWSNLITPYIINRTEIDAIAHPKISNPYFLDGGTNTQPEEVKGKGLSKYSWLYNNVSSCEARGCDRQENTNFGYWTTKYYIDKNGVTRVWIQSWEGMVLTVVGSRSDTYGLRPAVKISKALFN